MNKYFTILFLSETANLSEVKKAYRKLAKKYHPDKNSGSEEYAEEFRKIQDAYEKILEHLTYKKDQSESKKETNYSENSKSKNTENKSSKTNQTESSKEQSFEENIFEEMFNDFEENIEEENKIALTHQIGENINVGHFEYNVIKSKFSKNVGENFLKSEADGIYLIVELKITNKSNIQRKLHNYMFRLSNFENDFFEYSTKGLSVISMSGIKCIDIFGKDFNPKIPVSVNLIFEVPEENIYFLTLCGGDYVWDENNICICKEIEVVKLF